MVPERLEEELARRAVAAHLKVEVSRFEDGTSNGQVDALIHIRDGFPLEVVSEHDVTYRKLWIALGKYGHSIEASLSHDWYVRLNRLAIVRDIYEVILNELPPPEDASDLVGVDPSPKLARLGVRAVTAVPNPEHKGTIYFMAPISTGSGGADTLGEWASRFLESQSDVAEKLERHGGEQRHAFVWGTGFSDVGARLQMSGAGPAPAADPTLPAAITHLWVGSLIVGHEVMYWSPDSGWVKTGWFTPEN